MLIHPRRSRVLEGNANVARPYPWKCRSCGKQTLSPAVVDYSTSLEHDGRSYDFVIPELELLECTSCGQRVLPDGAQERVYDGLRREAGLLTPVEIRENRKRLRLKQEQLANDLGVAKETVSRWETGAQIQQRHTDLLLRIYFDLPECRRYFTREPGNHHTSPLVQIKRPPIPATTETFSRWSVLSPVSMNH
jgi:putative zinc finger/helix-turn-helix YgiT family protein